MKSAFPKIFLSAFILLAFQSGHSRDFKQFKGEYDLVGVDLLDQPCEVAEVKNFVYEKDLARFTFESGTFYFLRYIDDRPTTAIFIGKGNAQIEIPSNTERNSLYCITKDSSVNESFETCFIRFADNLDNYVREKFSTSQSTLHWKVYNVAKQTQGEVFFKPVIQHTYDNYFELLRSVYERAEDGYFWIDFNRYVYTFDPNQPEEFRLAYEFEGGDFETTEAAILQRKGRAVYDDSLLSNIPYPTTIIDRAGKFTMGGQDGLQVDDAEATVKMVVNADSLKYLSLFMDYHLVEDSIYFDGFPVDYHRRKTFDFIGVILPEYFYKGDTLEFTLWYKGKDFDQVFPYVENPEASTISVELAIRSGSNYYIPGKIGDVQNNIIEAIPDRKYNTFYFQGYVSGADTVLVSSSSGIPINFIRLGHISKHNYNCYVPDNIQETSAMDAFNYMTERFGAPPAAFEIFVSPEMGQGMPGLVYVPQVVCLSDWEAFGGMDLTAGDGVGNQWFGGAMRPATDRESWTKHALSNFISLLYVEHARGSKAYYSNLYNRSDTLLKTMHRNWDLPLATGSRLRPTVLSSKGIWMMHMLRFMMFDPNTKTSPNFYKFLQELSVTCNSTTFTNSDFVKLAEKYYGASLTDFFAQWLYGYYFPEFEVEYKIAQREGGYFIDGTVVTKRVDADFAMPVIMRVELKGGGSEQSVYESKMVRAPKSDFTLGPYETEPKKFVFNEFFSVLSEDKVKKK